MSRRFITSRMRHGVVVLALFALFPLVTNATPASAAETGRSTATTKVKDLPSHPPLAPNIAAAPVSGKPQPGTRVGVAQTWTVGLIASPTVLWPYQYSTLTATANADVGPTPYYIRIYDLQAHAFIASCGFGTTCTTYVTRPHADTRYYRAIIAPWTTAYPSSGIVAQSGDVVVHWRSLTVALQATPTTLPVGGYSHLVATTDTDVGPTPFYIEIYDHTTGVRLVACGFGTTCSVWVTQATATTHQFVAYVSLWSTANPPTGVQATSNTSFVTWDNGGWRITLDLTYNTNGTVTAHTVTNMDIGPTPWFTEIFNENTGARIGLCAFGTNCYAVLTPPPGRTDLVAFVSSYDTNYPPANIQASSNVETIWVNPLLARSARVQLAPLPH